MRALLDTHTLIWAVDDPAKLGPTATTILQLPTNQLSLSGAQLRSGKSPLKWEPRS